MSFFHAFLLFQELCISELVTNFTGEAFRGSC
jgi:hypothetical protein